MILDRIRNRQARDEALYEEAVAQAERNEQKRLEEEAAWGWPEDGEWEPRERAFTPAELELLEPVCERALCTEASPDTFRDAAAVRIVQQFGVPQRKNAPDAHSYLRALAQRHFVDVAKLYLKRNPQASVVDLGCGLSTTLRQLDNRKLHWYNIDTPERLALRSELELDTTGRIITVPANPKDPAWFDEVRFIKRKGLILMINDVSDAWSAWDLKNLLYGVRERFPDTLVMFECIGGNAAKSRHEGFRLFDLNAKAVFHAWLDEPSTRVYETSKLPEELSKSADIAQDTRKQIGRCYSKGEQILVDIIF